ncbi:MAG: nucleotide sugar dehydrogenase [Candidatus Undinarchaeales archaeon]|jgi:nucleotide sugar dehydrogenase|nr:nucleotide sugar dehydrogenase [Candidatus Undinarchaeales archaeon]
MSKVCVVGLGYVGLPLACLCAKKGHGVAGLDIDSEKIEQINNGTSPINDSALVTAVKEVQGKLKATTDASVVKEAEIIIVCVPTPVDENKHPNLEPLKKAVKTISENLQNGQVIVVESTIFPGTTEDILKPILEESGLKAGTDFFVAHCPERIDPGNKKWTLENIPRVLGAGSEQGAEKAKQFYESILTSPVNVLSTLKSAEAVKVVENTFRDINIAYVNELAKSFDKAGIDVVEVIEGAAIKPFAFMAHYPGCGVGGHCIPVDPYYLIDKAEQDGFKHTFLKMAREINNSMPQYTIDLLENLAGDLSGAKVGVLGLAYKPDVDDVRESPSLDIIKILKQKNAEVTVFDPNIPEKSDAGSLDEVLEKVDYVVVATAHKEFKAISAEQLKNAGIKAIVDGRNCLDKKSIESAGVKYKGIGQ